MNLIEVNSKADKKEFLKTARIIYSDDLNWVCPIDRQIDEIFDPKTNVFAKNGEFSRWILKDEHGKLIGRIAAFINKSKAYGFEQPTGGIGFFECINNQEAAFLLFDTCKDWLIARGMEAMDGPINFGENDNFWGLLVEGFNPPVYGMTFNKPYYQAFFENYGFNSYFEQVSNYIDLKKPFPERFWKIAEWSLNRPGINFRHFKMSESDKFMNDLKEVHQNAWEFHENFVPINMDDLKTKLNDAKSFLIEEFIWFAYHENEPIAFLVMFPDVNQVLKHLNGKLHFFNKLKFLWLLKKRVITTARIIIMGVKPKFQRMGVESGIFWHMDKAMKKHPEYNRIELSWVGDFNPKMAALHAAVGGMFSKKHITYRMLFKDNSNFKRSTLIPLDTKYKGTQ